MQEGLTESNLHNTFAVISRSCKLFFQLTLEENSGTSSRGAAITCRVEHIHCAGDNDVDYFIDARNALKFDTFTI